MINGLERHTSSASNRFQQDNHILVNIPFLPIFMLWPYKEEYREYYSKLYLKIPQHFKSQRDIIRAQLLL